MGNQKGGISEDNESRLITKIKKHIPLLLGMYDMIISALAYFVTLWIRFDCRYTQIPDRFLEAWMKFAPIYALVTVLVYRLLKLYRSIWRFASFSEMERMLTASAVLGAFHTIVLTEWLTRMPISYYIGGISIQFMLSLGIRFAYRFMHLVMNRMVWNAPAGTATNVMLIGAGNAGRMILRDLQTSSRMSERVCCIIDDDPAKQGKYIDGVKVAGGREGILLNVEKYGIEKIILAIPSASPQERRDILDICKETSCELKNLPGLYQLVEGTVKVSTLRDVAIEDLLGREPVSVDMAEIYSFISGKTILVTGGGGSIGSELCRQIASHDPKQLIIYDIYENNAHAIQLELGDKYPDLNLSVIIGSVRDSRRLNQVFDTYRPDVVYHAAAHKHVPLMEGSPCEAIKNNAVGTYKTAYAAMTHGCRRFVLISTDKAVNPTNIMGASKRLCEMIIQTYARKISEGRAGELAPMSVHGESVRRTGSCGTDSCDPICSKEGIQAESAGSGSETAQSIAEGSGSGTAQSTAGRVQTEGCAGEAQEMPRTEFVAVRFGNVLGSNGSVVPRFKEQIARGGPVTVTHPDIIRYFMTIPEAASLVLQAGVYARGGEIFVLDMGSPVKIDTLARNLIKLSGLRPDTDIKIEYTGLRPGEKLYEEKLMSEEGLRTTPNHLIHIGSPLDFDTDLFLKQLNELMDAAYDNDEEGIRDMVEKVVPTYHPA